MADRGRPSLYTEAVADEILARLAQGQTLREICRDDHLPHESTVRLWVAENRDGFSTRHARARETQLDVWADEISNIADDGSNDWMERARKDGSVEIVLNREHVARSQLRIDTRKWLLAKLRPEKYGESVKLDVDKRVAIMVVDARQPKRVTTNGHDHRDSEPLALPAVSRKPVDVPH